MFKRLDLPIRMNEFLVTITPLLGIAGDEDNVRLFAISNYLSLSEDKLAIYLDSKDFPGELSLNLLRKKEDHILMAAYNDNKLDSKFLISSKSIAPFTYGYSILTLEAKLVESVQTSEGLSFGVYEIIHASGDFALDPDFNDDTSVAKTIEMMSMSAVDNRVVKRKVKTN